jgi:hypothetical protein
MADSHAAVMRVSAENNPGLIQTGFGRAYGLNVGNCGPAPTHSRIYRFFESMTKSGGSDSQQCSWLTTALPRGNASLYTVYNRALSEAGASDIWRVRINGTALEPHERALGYSSARLVLASGEIKSSLTIYSATGDKPDADVYGCYGCTATPLGLIPWQFTERSGSTGWTAITENESNDITPANSGGRSDDRWTVTPITNGAFSVRHRCFSDQRYGC